ncbi:response regulator [Phormidium pseudopriestleyi FRX01]|uniref:Response regulator n=1 Tax=Phormidium pseudopriestleyi FRX01 TaxID=1759528 RepID=A0ABS3FPE6_9CYAN|nr:response regulator [Phormidium pseudopriestleyi]MBO0348989.1 response regulator [Phormidium pseudopriestleyi FRX01]
MVNQSLTPHPDLANPITILIVDDVLDNIRLLSRILVKRGYQTRKALNGSMALTAIKASKPHLILLDVQMPEMSGFELCQLIKSHPDTADIPIIFVSANDDSSEKRKAIQFGGVDYIPKPFNIEKLVEVIKKQIELTLIN